MWTTHRLFVAALLTCVGCHGAPAPGGPGGGEVDGATGDGSATLVLGPFVVAPGAERYVCQDFANPFGADDTPVAAIASHATAGVHHLLVFYAPGAVDGAPADCSGTEFAAGPYGSQRADDRLTFPPGVAAVIPAGNGLRLQAHYLNASTAPITATVMLQLTPAPPGSVRDRAAVLFFSNRDLHVPAGAHGVVAQKSCAVPFDVNLLDATGHMHQHGVGFTASTPMRTLFTSTAWEDVAPAQFDPPVHVAAGTPITFACTYDNDGPTDVGYGTSAATDEMCIFTAQFYPAPFGGWSCL